MNWLTAKVAQGIAVALLVACIGLGARGCSLSSDLKTATAEKNTAIAEKTTAVTERDSWKAKTADALAANRAFDAAFAQMQEQALEDQRLAAAAAHQAAAAVAAAKRDEVRAEQDLAAFKRRFANKPADCTAALARLDAVCKIGSY